jgi:hypothetical protein
LPTVHARALARAAEILGGAAALTDRLRVTPEGLRLWLSGKIEPPPRVFLEAVDIIIKYQLTELSRDGEGKGKRPGPGDDT